MQLRRLAWTCTMVTAVLLGTTSPSQSGPYSDSLSKCLVESTSTADKTVLVRWMFGIMALHPDVQAGYDHSRAAIRHYEGSGAACAPVTDNCGKETREAIRYEGSATLRASFSLLGQVAARELFTHPKVAEGLAGLGKDMDVKKRKELTATPQ